MCAANVAAPYADGVLMSQSLVASLLRGGWSFAGRKNFYQGRDFFISSRKIVK
jgi:hypothetical protein